MRKCALLGNILQKMSIDLIPKHANFKKNVFDNYIYTV